jgi:hypothetical protein
MQGATQDDASMAQDDVNFKFLKIIKMNPSPTISFMLMLLVVYMFDDGGHPETTIHCG